MKSGIKISMVALATMALMLSATGVSAAPHETLGEIAAQCDWSSWRVDTYDPDTDDGDGMDDVRSHNSYSFIGTYLECTAVTDMRLEGTWDVQLYGESDDYWHSGIGENCAEGGSRKVDSDGEVHSYPLTATALQSNVDLTGEVHLTRLGTTVLADGPLYGDPEEYWFQAEWEMIPMDGDCYEDPVSYWSHEGYGNIYSAAWSQHDCGLDSADPHCDNLDAGDALGPVSVLAGWASDFIGNLTGGDLVDVAPPGPGESEQCQAAGGSDGRVIDSTAQGVRTFVYVYQPAVDEVWVCARVEETATGEGYGGRLEATPTDAGPQVTGGPGSPSTDSDSTACTTTTPNDVPGSHPISSGGVGPVDYMVDAYADDSEAWVCLQVGSSDYRVVVPLGSGSPNVEFGTVASWHPDE